MKPAIWESAMERVRSSIGDDAFNVWLSTTALEDFLAEERRLLMVVPNEFYRRWIEKRYLGAIERAFAETLGSPVAIELVVDSEDEPALGEEDSEEKVLQQRKDPGTADHTSFSRSQGIFEELHRGNGEGFQLPGVIRHRYQEGAAGEQAPTPRLNPRYVFDEFVVGESNRYAHAAATAVADPNGKAFNPLFIYGGSGLGKTHLMQAIGHRMYTLDRRLRVLYVTSEHFINGFIDAIQNKRHVEFRAAYRNVDLLLIDDVQFLMGKERTQQEFFHTFNALYDAGKKVVVTSDRPPKDLSTLEDRLRSRFEWGLLVDIQMPDLETRVAILRKKSQQEGIHLPNDVLMFIGERVTQNVREMEGVLKRLRMAASLHYRPIDLEAARDVLGHLMIGSPQPRVAVEDVQRAVCQYFNISMSELMGKNRSKKFSQPRHLAQYLCRKLTDLSFPDIAQKFGGKDHTSIIYACRKVDQSAQKDANMANVINYLTKQITKGSDQ